MKINIMLDNSALVPVRAHDADAGWDLRTPVDITVHPHDSVTVDTGVHIEIPYGYVGFLKSKSGLNVNRGIQTEGVIDSGYTGSIVVKIYNNGDDESIFHRGNKITQLVLLPILQVEELNVVRSFGETDRGSGGFGSSGV